MKKQILIVVAVLFVFVITAQAQILEPLNNCIVEPINKTITIEVYSNGCTQKTDFNFKRTKDTLSVFRIKKDFCKMVPELKQFTFTTKETGIDLSQIKWLKNTCIQKPTGIKTMVVKQQLKKKTSSK